jgi:hypothetical protein
MKTKQNWGSLAAIILGILLILGGIKAVSSPPGDPSGIINGIVIVIGALIYRSAKKRREIFKKSYFRIGLEFFGVLIILFLSLSPNNLLSLMVEYPVQYLIIPLWALVAYVYAVLRTFDKSNDKT